MTSNSIPLLGSGSTPRPDVGLNVYVDNIPTPLKNWHLLVQSSSGSMSVIKDLGEDECHRMAEKILHAPAFDVKVADCFQ